MAVKLPSAVVTVIVVFPPLTGFTTPLASTVATNGLLDVKLIFLFVAFSGATVAIRFKVSVIFIVAFVLSRLIPVTSTCCCTGRC